jgi:hypothetical protein
VPILPDIPELFAPPPPPAAPEPPVLAPAEPIPPVLLLYVMYDEVSLLVLPALDFRPEAPPPPEPPEPPPPPLFILPPKPPPYAVSLILLSFAIIVVLSTNVDLCYEENNRNTSHCYICSGVYCIPAFRMRWWRGWRWGRQQPRHS